MSGIHLHHVIDHVRGRHVPIGPEARDEFLSLTAQADCYLFEQVPLDQVDEDLFSYPFPTKTEKEFFIERLIFFPAPVCWFEYQDPFGRTGLLIDARSPQVLRVNAIVMRENNSLLFGWGVWIEMLWSDIYSGVCKMTGDPLQCAKMRRIRERDPDFEQVLCNRLSLALYLTLMLNSRSTQIGPPIGAPPTLNKAREKRGRAPLPAHRVVTIVPKIYVDQEPSGLNPHRSPRLHWRRSHLRHFENPTPNSKHLAEHVHQGRAGWYVVQVPRCLVGKAELGEITHEYRVL